MICIHVFSNSLTFFAVSFNFNHIFKIYREELPGGSVGQGSSVVIAVVSVAVVAQVPSLALEFLHPAGMATKK